MADENKQSTPQIHPIIDMISDHIIPITAEESMTENLALTEQGGEKLLAALKALPPRSNQFREAVAELYILIVALNTKLASMQASAAIEEIVSKIPEGARLLGIKFTDRAKEQYEKIGSEFNKFIGQRPEENTSGKPTLSAKDLLRSQHISPT